MYTIVRRLAALGALWVLMCGVSAYAELNLTDAREVLAQALDNARSDYDRALLLRGFEQRYRGVDDGSMARPALDSAATAALARMDGDICGTPFALDLAAALDNIADPEVREAAIAALNSKPAQLTELVSDANFEVWYTTDSGTYPADAVAKAYADKVLDYMAKSNATEIVSWGYMEGKSHTDSPYTETAKYQVYVYDIGGAYGQTGGYIPNPAGSASVCRTWSEIGIDNAAALHGDDSLLLSTCAHEYHHASEVAYIDRSIITNKWILEASTAWIDYQVRLQYPAITGNGSVNIFLDRVNWHQARPQRPLDKINDPDVTDVYDGCLFFWFLCDNQVIGGCSRTINLNFWKDMQVYNSEAKIFDCFNTALSGLGAYYNSFNKIFPFYMGANYAWSSWYPLAIDDVKVENSAAPHTLDYSTPTSHKVAPVAVAVDHLAAKYYKFVPGATLLEPTTMSVKVEGPVGKDIGAVATTKRKDGSSVMQVFSFDPATGKGEVGVSGFCATDVTEVVLAVVNSAKSSADDAMAFKYSAELMKGFVFAIDDTGSMSDDIANAKAGAFSVMDENMADGNVVLYTLLSFKDGPPTYHGQSSDVPTMKAMVNALYASGGDGWPESSLTTLRYAAGICANSNIMLITDAPSNSYGVDDTYATWGEIVDTISTLAAANCSAHIVYSGGDGSTAALDNDGKPLPPQAREVYFTYGEGYKTTASETGGLYFNLGGADIVNAAEMIVKSTTVNTTIAYFNSKDATAYTVPVDATAESLQLSLNAASTGMTFEIKDPSGTVVTDANPGVTVVYAGNSIQYSLDSTVVEVGNWTATIGGIGSFSFIASAATSNPMNYTGATSVGVNSYLTMAANFGAVVPGMTFALVAQDNSSSTTVSMSSSDGLNYSGAQKMSSPGRFAFQARQASSFFQRMAPELINVSDLGVAVDAASKSVAPGASATSAFTVTNLGGVALNCELYANSLRGWADLSGIPSTLTLEAGASQLYVVPVAVPADAAMGSIDTVSLQAVDATTISISATGTTNIVASTAPTLWRLTVVGGTGGGSFAAGTAVPIASTAGDSFIQWTTLDGDTSYIASVTSPNTTVTMPNHDAQVIAVDTYTVTFVAGAGGAVSPAGAQAVKRGSNSSAVTATPAAKYVFVNWTLDGAAYSTANPLTVENVQGNLTLTANFMELWQVAQGSIFYVSAGDGKTFTKKPKIAVVGLKGSVKVLTSAKAFKGAGVDSVRCEWPAKATPGVYSLTADKAPVAKGVQVKAPDATMTPNTGKYKDKIVLNGHFFGIKVPKVWMQFTDAKGKLKKAPCKIVKPYAFPDAKGKPNKSIMEVEPELAGLSQVTFEVPNKIDATTPATVVIDFGKPMGQLPPIPFNP